MIYQIRAYSTDSYSTRESAVASGGTWLIAGDVESTKYIEKKTFHLTSPFYDLLDCAENTANALGYSDTLNYYITDENGSVVWEGRP